MSTFFFLSVEMIFSCVQEKDKNANRMLKIRLRNFLTQNRADTSRNSLINYRYSIDSSMYIVFAKRYLYFSINAIKYKS